MIRAIFFSAEWCAPCKILKPIWSKLVEEFGGKMAFEVVDIDSNSQMASEMKIMAVPTIIFVDGENVLNSVVGLIGEDKLKEKIEGMLKKEVESIYYSRDADYTGIRIEEKDFYGKPASQLTFTCFFRNYIAAKIISIIWNPIISENFVPKIWFWGYLAPYFF